MCFGLPIVATGITGSGVPWVNQHGTSGLNVKPGDPQALAAALDLLLADPALCKSLGEGARSRYEANFTHEVSGAAVMAVYRALVRN
jgi:rhamnosyl/mannosyltransferase